MPDARVRVAYVIDDLGFGGAQRQLSLLAPALQRREDIDVAVFCMSGQTEPFATRLREHGVEVVHAERRSSFDAARLRALRRFLRDWKADIVHAFLDASNVYGFIAARSLHLHIALSLQSDRIALQGVRGRVLSVMLRRAERVFTNSSSGAQTLIYKVGVGEHRVRLVYNWVADDAFVTHKSGESPVVGYVGRFVALKRVGRLVDAFAGVALAHPSAQLVLVGDGPERAAIESRVGNAGLGGRVTFTGEVEDVRPLLSRFACLVVPSEFEGLPNVVLEAMAAGVPVVARPVGDLPEIVQPGRTGLLVDDDSVDALSAAILDATRDEGLSLAARDAGPAYIREHHSIERAVAVHADEYERLKYTRAGLD
jgi:glycosyltransferase involved in cell wall biosynthesis